MDSQRRTPVVKPQHLELQMPHEGGIRIDWAEWLRTLERKRRLLLRRDVPTHRPFPPEYLAAGTYVSFRLDGIVLSEQEVAAAMARGSAQKSCRSRLTQRIRNHVSILRHIELAIRRGEPLKPTAVVRWYTSISCGLSTAALDDSTATRLESVVRRINSPQLRLQAAIMEVAHVHAALIAEPFVPSFNGILARLLMQYHLGRCGLPPVLFDPEMDGPLLWDEPRLLKRLVALIDATCDLLLAEQG